MYPAGECATHYEEVLDEFPMREAHAIDGEMLQQVQRELEGLDFNSEDCFLVCLERGTPIDLLYSPMQYQIYGTYSPSHT